MRELDKTNQKGNKEGPIGIWGWNTLPILNLLALSIACVISAIALPFAIGDADFSRSEIATMISIVIEGAAAIPVLIWAFKRDSRYPKYCSYLFVACVALDVLMIGVVQGLGGKPASGCLRSVIFAIVWIQYFKKSVRIRNTYLGGINSAGSQEQTAGGENAALASILPVGRSGLAIAAGYLGLVSIVPIFAPIALLVGIAALKDIKEHPGRLGKGRAWFAIIFGGIMSVVLFVILVAMTLPKT